MKTPRPKAKVVPQEFIGFWFFVLEEFPKLSERKKQNDEWVPKDGEKTKALIAEDDEGLQGGTGDRMS